LLIGRACLLIGKIDEEIDADYFPIYFLDEKVEKIYFLVDRERISISGGRGSNGDFYFL
jgi:hypothetical protein